MGEFLLIILVPIAIIGGFLYLTQAPSATGVSSLRREKKSIRITFIHCWLFSAYPLRPFRYCPEHDSYLLLTQAMQPLVERLPVKHYHDWLVAQQRHPTIEPKHHRGQTDWTLTMTYGAILYTSHRLQVTHDQARYWLLCHFYAAATKQDLQPVVIEEIVEEKEEPGTIVVEPEPTCILAPILPPRETEFYDHNTGTLSFPLAVQEEEEEKKEGEQEEPEPGVLTNQTLTELLAAQEKARFTSLCKTKLMKVVQCTQGQKITQDLLINKQKILKQSEWRLLLNSDEGILWELGIVEKNELGETVITKGLDTIILLVEAWIEAQAW